MNPIQPLVRLVLAGFLCLSSSSCVAAIVASGWVDHPHFDKLSKEQIREELGEPIHTQSFVPPLPLGQVEGYASYVRSDTAKSKGGLERIAAEPLPGVDVACFEVYRVEGILRQYTHHGPGQLLIFSLGTAAMLEMFGVEGFAPFWALELFVDAPLTLLALTWRFRHRNDDIWLTYWYDESGSVIDHIHSDVRTPVSAAPAP